MWLEESVYTMTFGLSLLRFQEPNLIFAELLTHKEQVFIISKKDSICKKKKSQSILEKASSCVSKEKS